MAELTSESKGKQLVNLLGNQAFDFVKDLVTSAINNIENYIESKPKYLGALNYAVLKLLKEFSSLFGNEIRTVYRDTDAYNILLSLYGLYSLHDLALKEITEIIDHLIQPQDINLSEEDQEIADSLLIHLLF